MITGPLELHRQLDVPDRRFDPVPFLDLCIIGLFMTIFGSRFIFAPGVPIDLPVVAAEGREGIPTTTVLTVRRDGLILFEGGDFRLDTLTAGFGNFMKGNRDASPVLLVKAPQNVEVQVLMEIFDRARTAGFVKVQLAAEEKKRPVEFLSTKPGGGT